MECTVFFMFKGYRHENFFDERTKKEAVDAASFVKISEITTSDYTMPYASIALATFTKPAMLAPIT